MENPPKISRVKLVEESDRGCVLVGAAILEGRLEDIFRTVFSRNGIAKKMQDTMFDSNGPLSTFSSKIKLAYSLGFVAKEIYDDLDCIRRIRNDFAHTVNEVDFIEHSVAGVIEGLNCVQKHKGKLQRYSPSESPAEKHPFYEAKLMSAGFIKYTKSLFALGIASLESSLILSLIRQADGEGKPAGA
jgi:DNA-binding MltR family transcriptional regulator